MTIDAPKPGPVVPPAAVRGAGVNQDDIEKRSRVIALLLPYVKGVDDLIDVAEWIIHGGAPDGE